MNFECHITCRVQDAEKCKSVAQGLHWKCSQIAGDPVLGNNPFFYLTTHDSDYGMLLSKLGATVDMLKRYGVRPLREKIELIVHDKRFDK